jgi:hypothetical protein
MHRRVAGLPHVQSSHCRQDAAKANQHRSRSSVPLPSVARQLADPRDRETKSVPHAPMSHPFVERLIGTIRREFLYRTLFWNSLDLL